MDSKWIKPVLLGVGFGVILTSCSIFQREEVPEAPYVKINNLEEIEELPGRDSYGFLRGEAVVKEARVKRNESLYIILRSLDVSPQTIYELQQQAKGKFQSNRIIRNQKYYTYHNPEDDKAFRLIFHSSATDYVVFDWEDEIKVTTGQKEIRREIREASGVITSSLYEALVEKDINILVANRLSEIFGWQIDFFRLYRGDKFKVIYEKQFVEDKPYGIGRILAAEFEHRGVKYDAYYYENDEIAGYFDSEGNGVQKALLKAPFTYSQRISSGFSYNRFHPVLKERRPHYGVDYAAPLGTPVIATGDGEVIESRYRGGNGNIVKIRHNSTYTTAYLHLNGFAKGIRKGVKVKQGQVIGYVGKTGLASGVHLDYRVYMNDKPVNPLTIELPPSKGISQDDMDNFYNVIKEWQYRLDGMTYTLSEVTEAGF